MCCSRATPPPQLPREVLTTSASGLCLCVAPAIVSRNNLQARRASRVSRPSEGAFQLNLLMTNDSTPRGDASAESPSAHLERDRLSRRERGVWRAALLLLGVLALAFAATS